MCVCQQSAGERRLQELRGLFNSSPLPLGDGAKRVGGLWSQISVDKGKHSSQCKDLKLLFNITVKSRARRCDWVLEPAVLELEAKRTSLGVLWERGQRGRRSSASRRPLLPPRRVLLSIPNIIQSSPILNPDLLYSNRSWARGGGNHMKCHAPGIVRKAELIIQTCLLTCKSELEGKQQARRVAFGCVDHSLTAPVARFKTGNSTTQGFHLCVSGRGWSGCGCIWHQWV